MNEGEGDESKSEIQKFEYLENEKSFLDEVKSIFHNYLKYCHLLKQTKIENTSFKLSQNFTKYHCNQKQV